MNWGQHKTLLQITQKLAAERRPHYDQGKVGMIWAMDPTSPFTLRPSSRPDKVEATMISSHLKPKPPEMGAEHSLDAHGHPSKASSHIVQEFEQLVPKARLLGGSRNALFRIDSPVEVAP
jgi:hypothetical protein